MLSLGSTASTRSWSVSLPDQELSKEGATKRNGAMTKGPLRLLRMCELHAPRDSLQGASRSERVALAGDHDFQRGAGSSVFDTDQVEAGGNRASARFSAVPGGPAGAA